MVAAKQPIGLLYSNYCGSISSPSGCYSYHNYSCTSSPSGCKAAIIKAAAQATINSLYKQRYALLIQPINSSSRSYYIRYHSSSCCMNSRYYSSFRCY